MLTWQTKNLLLFFNPFQTHCTCDLLVLVRTFHLNFVTATAFFWAESLRPRSVATPSAPAAPPRRLPWRNREPPPTGLKLLGQDRQCHGWKSSVAVRRPKEAQGCGPKDRLELNSWGIHLGASNKWSELNG